MVVDTVVMQSSLDTLGDYSLQFNRWLLKSIGIWPKSSVTTKMEKVISSILIVICYFFILMTLVPCLLHLVLENDDFQSKLLVLGPMTHWLFGIIAYTSLLVHAKEIKWCEEQVKSDWCATTRPKVHQMMLKNAKFGRYVVAFCTAFMQGSVLFYNTEKTLTTQIIQDGNETRTIRELPLTAYKKLIPYDTSPTNEIIIATQFVSVIIVNSTFAGAFSLSAVLTIHISGQLDTLVLWITEIVDQAAGNGKRFSFRDVGAVVEKHLNILNFISRIEAIMSVICFMELFNYTFSICLLGYYILMDWADQDFQSMATYTLILCSMSVNIFMQSFIGEVITEQCNKVGEAVYMSSWYYLHTKDVLDLMMIISRSCKETKITAGKVVHMSFYTYAGVIKTGFAYLNILLQTI